MKDAWHGLRECGREEPRHAKVEMGKRREAVISIRLKGKNTIKFEKPDVNKRIPRSFMWVPRNYACPLFGEGSRRAKTVVLVELPHL